jgi:putative ABC transport system permease protein
MNPVDRWFAALLSLFPAEFRTRHGEDMRDTFAAACEEHRSRGRLRFGLFLVRTTVDLFVAGLRHRLRRPHQRRHAAPRTEMPRGAPVSWLDVKLALRMLAKHPGLTVVAMLALAIGIPVGLAPSHFMDGVMTPLPVPDGDRMRALRLWSPALGRAAQTTYRDYDVWRKALSSFEDIGAFQEHVYHVGADGGSRTVRGAAVSASALEILQVPPLLGRSFGPEDEARGAENVAVIGHDLWQALYAGDESVVGSSVRLAGVTYTVIGVMPEGFMFPERQSIWTPLRVNAADAAEAATPVSIYGKLAHDTSDRAALAEFELAAARSAPPGRDPRLIPQVVAFAHTLLPGLPGGPRQMPEFVAFQTLALLLLLVACANVGMLVFARTTTRGGELAVRTALGASRPRIVAQVFVECLILALLASGVGILLLASGEQMLWRVAPPELAAALPYWIDWGITSRTVLYVLGLATVSAVVAGVGPAMYFTGRSIQSTMQRARARRSGVRFGGLSGILIVLDVAVAVAAVGLAMTGSEILRDAGRSEAYVGIRADEYLAVGLAVPPGVDVGPAGVSARADRMAQTQRELVRLLRAEPEVRTVAVASTLPRMEHSPRLVEAEGVPLSDDRPGISTRTARVTTDYFRSLTQPVVAGRDFDESDVEGHRSSVIVNTTFVDRVFGGQNPIGRRIRFRPWGDGEPGPWKEIVGVVGHLGMRMVSAENDQGVYEPFAPGELSYVRMAIHVVEDPASLAPRVRALAAEVDPDAIVTVIGTLDEQFEGDWYVLLAISLGAMVLVGVLLALAATGLYAIMSFAVAQRTREIGIRTALGAGRHELVRTVATRALSQLVAGVMLGMPIAGMLFTSGQRKAFEGTVDTLLVGGAVMVIVGLLACTGPTLRALRIDPRAALTEEA